MTKLKLDQIKKISWFIEKWGSIEWVSKLWNSFWVKDRILTITSSWDNIEIDLNHISVERLDELNSILSDLCRKIWSETGKENRILWEMDTALSQIPQWLQKIVITIWNLWVSFKLLLHEWKITLNAMKGAKKNIKKNIETIKLLQIFLITIRKTLRQEKKKSPGIKENLEEVSATCKRLIERLEKYRKLEQESLEIIKK